METYDSPASIFKRYGDALRGTLCRMPSGAADLPAFFENAERSLYLAKLEHQRR